MKKEILFSIIIPVYNTKESFLNDCLSSVLNQSYDRYEVIVIDDGSNDETKKRLDQCKGITVIHQENKGISASRLAGLSIAKGDYIIHLDSDDIINRDTLKILNQIIETHHPDVILQDPSRFYHSIDKIEFRNTYFTEGIIDKNEVLTELCKLHINSICNKFVKREKYIGMEEVIDTSIINGEDLQQSTYVIMNSEVFYYTEEPLYYYRLNEDNRDYYRSVNLNDVNYPLPTYRLLFKDGNEYNSLLPIYKAASANTVVYTAFKICNLVKNSKERSELLDQLNNQPIIDALKSIPVKTGFISDTLFSLLINKNYLLFNLLAKVYRMIYGFDKSTYK